jgi:hypothetical protein
MKLDEVIPNPHHRMGHSRSVGAPPTLVWDELSRVPMSALPLGRALEGVRLLPARVSGSQHRSLAGRTFLEVTPIPVLFSERPHVVIAASLVATGMDQGRDGVPPRTHPGGHAVAHRDPRLGDGPEDAAGLRGLLVVHPCGQWCDPS